MIATPGLGGSPIALGQTQLYTASATQHEAMLGTIVVLKDADTGRPVAYQVLRNESGATLAAGAPVRYKANEHGRSVSGLAQRVHASFAGWVPKQYVNGVGANHIFLCLLEGPGVRGTDTVNLNQPMYDRFLNNRLAYNGFFCDFNSWVSGVELIGTHSGSPTFTYEDAEGGILIITNTNTDNHHAILHTGGAQFLFEQYKPIEFGGRVKLTEANTDDMNFLLGLVSGTITSGMGDNGAGPPASYSGANFHKLDGGTAIITEASVGSTQDTNASAGTQSSAFREFYCKIFPTTSALLTALFYIDNVLVETVTDFTYTSAAQMRFAFLLKNGGGNSEIANIDHLWCAQQRAG